MISPFNFQNQICCRKCDSINAAINLNYRYSVKLNAGSVLVQHYCIMSERQMDLVFLRLEIEKILSPSPDSFRKLLKKS